MEACATAHGWGRALGKLGYSVRLIPPVDVKPFVKREKNDAADAEAIVEAALRPTLRFVAVKTEDQQARAILFRNLRPTRSAFRMPLGCCCSVFKAASPRCRIAPQLSGNGRRIAVQLSRHVTHSVTLSAHQRDFLALIERQIASPRRLGRG